MKRIAVLTSGGDAPGMNACLRAVVKTAAAKGAHVFGALDGYDGLVDGNFRQLTVDRDGGAVGADPEVDAEGGHGGTLIGSARSARFREAKGRAQAAAKLKEKGLEGLVVIGGNGSLTGAQALMAEHGVRVMGIPASIDNDLGCTATCLGVDSALNTIVEACDKISDTARAHRRAFDAAQPANDDHRERYDDHAHRHAGLHRDHGRREGPAQRCQWRTGTANATVPSAAPSRIETAWRTRKWVDA